MTTLSRAESKAMYSWWWGSHISPKNSKWLKENLTDVDNKVRTMIKLIEVDEDSFARRAEMYYKKRPELMKLVEEFYRAYRALAERYDNATGVIRQAHRTMAEAFPNQVPPLTTDDSPLNLTPNQTPVQSSSAFLSVNGDGDFTDDSISVADQKAKKQLNFHGMNEKEQDMKKNGNLNAHVVSESERWRQFEIDIQSLREALAELEAEKEEKLSKLGFEVSRAKEISKGLNERATVAEAEVQSLKETLSNVETDRDASLFRYQQCLESISQYEQDSKELNNRACKAEHETELLKDELTQLKAEKESLLAKYMEALEKKEVETLRKSITELTIEKEAAIVKYEQCLDEKANLERVVTHAREEATRLRTEVQDGAAKLKDSKKQFHLLDRSNKALQSELDSLVKKQKELGRLWASVQEERMRSEASMQSLQNSHLEAREKLGIVSDELQKKVEDLKDMQIQNRSLQDEVRKVKNENKGLNDLNLSSVMLIKDLQEEIFELKEGKGRLEQELSNLNQRHRDIIGQIESLGFPPQSFCLYVNELQNENSRLKETCEKNNVEISSLHEKVDTMEKLVEKNELLESSLLDLQAELEGTRENLEKLSERNTSFENTLFDANMELEMLRMKSKNLEDSCCVFIDQNSVLATDKETLACQLGTTKKKVLALEEERALTLRRVEELLVLLDVEKRDHVKLRELSQTRIRDLENQVCLLQEVNYNVRKEFEKELDKVVNADFDFFILRNCVRDLNTTVIELLESNEELVFKVREGDEKEAVYLTEMERLREKVFTLQWAFEDLQKENYEVIEDKEALTKAFDSLAEEKCDLERECSCVVAKAITCDNLSFVLKNVIFELVKAYEIVEEESASKCMDVGELRERVGVLEGENVDLKDQIAVGYSAILSLRDSLASLEKHTVWNKELGNTDEEDKADTKQRHNLNADEVSDAQSNKVSILQEVQDRVQAVVKAIIHLKHHAETQYSTARSELDLAMQQIELLKPHSGSRRRSGGTSKRFVPRQDSNLKNKSPYGYELHKTSSYNSERANEHLMRDIMLDQVSDWSSRGKNVVASGSDDRILELWETTNHGEGIDLTVGKFSHVKVVKESKNDRPSLESTVDKELCVDDDQRGIDISKISSATYQDNYKRKTLGRLTSDVQKLSNLRITVQDLKEKIEMTERFSSDGVESDGIKDQLVGTEETISKLYDYSEKLMRKIENSSLASTSSSFDGSVTADSVDGGSARRRRYSEHVRRISEKIGSLQLEVQKVQFLLMKIDNKKTSKSGAEITENDSQTLLRDYLYSGAGVSKVARKQKKSQFCGCMQNPATKGD